MGVLENCTDLCYLMSDFFYKHKCTNGYIDPIKILITTLLKKENISFVLEE